MLKIRLAQRGTKNKRQYRIVAIEEYKRRNGKAIEILGFFNPQVKPPQIKIQQPRIDYWISKGAQLTPGVKKLLEKTA